MGNSKAQNAQNNSGEHIQGEHIQGEHIQGEHILAFDFSASRGSLCLWSNLGGQLGGSEQGVEQGVEQGRGAVLLASRQALASELSAKAEILPALLDALLSRCEVTYASLQAICFVRGPGSYTGLRASLAVAKGLRLAHTSTPALATYSLTSFEAALLAMQTKNMEIKNSEAKNSEARAQDAITLALVESFHDIWYAQVFRSNQAIGQPLGQPLGQPQALDDKKLAQLVASLLAKGEKLFLCGAKAAAAAEMLEASGYNNLRDNLRSNLILAGGDSKAEDFSRPLAERLATRGKATSDKAISEKAQQVVNYASGEEALLPLYIGGGV